MRISDLKTPRIVVKKHERTLELFDGDYLVKIFKITLGFDPLGDKEIEGDGRTPEGEFYVFVKNAKSKFTASLGLSYPNEEDARRGLDGELIWQSEHDEIVDAIRHRRKPPQKTKLGGEIYIHGGGTQKDWTHGCVALIDLEMQELFDAVSVGTRVSIVA